MIVNGAVRDVTAIREIDYPVWAKGVTPITGKFRMGAIEKAEDTMRDLIAKKAPISELRPLFRKRYD